VTTPEIILQPGAHILKDMNIKRPPKAEYLTGKRALAPGSTVTLF